MGEQELDQTWLHLRNLIISETGNYRCAGSVQTVAAKTQFSNFSECFLGEIYDNLFLRCFLFNKARCELFFLNISNSTNAYVLGYSEIVGRQGS